MKKKDNNEYFDNINILCFNRPEYAKKVFNSIKAQIGNLEEKININIWIDGYKNSKEEFLKNRDQTSEVYKIAKDTFDISNIFQMKENIGIARMYSKAEEYCLKNSTKKYALFFEDDYVLGESYLAAMDLLMEWAFNKKEISIVTAHGIISEYLDSYFYEISENPLLGPSPVHSLWAYAIKIEHLKERKVFLDEYLSLIKNTPYHKRNNVLILEFFNSKGIPFIHGTSQDYAKHAALIYYDKLAITIPNYLGEYIGIKGEHTNLQLFRKLGYDRKKLDIFNLEEYKKKLNLYSDFDSLKKIRKFELLIMNLQYQIELSELKLKKSNYTLKSFLKYFIKSKLSKFKNLFKSI